MNMCRTCLKTPADKHILQLEKAIKGGNKNCFEIMLFCLDIKVTQDCKLTRSLCSNCFRKIVLIYKFKAISLKNDSYLKSITPVVQFEDHKLSVYVDENGIKHENYLELDEFGPSLVEKSNVEIKIEVDVKDYTFEDDHIDVKNEDMLHDAESDEEPLIVVKKLKSDDVKESAPVYKKSAHSIKAKLPKQRKVKQEQQVCEECGKSVRNLKEHSLLHQPRDQQTVKCEACPKYFASRQRQRRHYKRAHALGLKYKCDICNKEVRDVNKHKMMIHHKAMLPYGCVSCERRYMYRSALETHMTTHTNEFPYECDICQKRFRSKNQVSSHIREMHLQEKNYQCEFCSKTFYGKSPFEQHSRTHAKERLYKCEECGLALKTLETLKKHRTVHSGVKKFHCTLCTKTFRISGREMHLQEKNYQCEFCSKTFYGKSPFEQHSRTHAKERLYKCEECGLALKTLETLKKHRTVHSGVKKFHCTLCTKTFRISGSLTSHMMTHTKEKPFQCQFCDARFRRSHHLKRHEFSLHTKHKKTE